MRTLLAGALVALIACAGGAHAQTVSVDSTPVVIHAGAPSEGVITERTQIVSRQRVTTVRAAVLDEAAARPAANGRQREGFPAGEALFGIYDGHDAWAYCALRESFWTGDALTCYQDTDADGRFDVAKPSGAPFLGIPFFILTQNAEARTLSTPAAFHRVPYAQGPSIEAGLQLVLVEARGRRQASATVSFGYIVNAGRFIPVRGNSATHTFGQDAAAVVLSVADARVELSGAPVRGQLRYRVVEPIPAHIERVTMQQITTTGYTYVPIYIPR